MIQHYACRTDHIPSSSRAIFQRPENSTQHRLIGKHLIQRTAIEVLMLNGTGRVHHGDELIAVVDIVLRHYRLTGHCQRLVDAVAGIVIRVPLMCFMPTNASRLNPDYADFSVKVHGTVDSHRCRLLTIQTKRPPFALLGRRITMPNLLAPPFPKRRRRYKLHRDHLTETFDQQLFGSIGGL